MGGRRKKTEDTGTEAPTNIETGRRKRATQDRLPGAEVHTEPEVQAAFAEYRDARDAHTEATQAIVNKKKLLFAIMKKKSIKTYRAFGLIASIDTTEELHVSKDGKAEEDAAAE